MAIKKDLTYVVIALMCSCLMACGFHLRGIEQTSYKSVHMQGSTLVISKDLNQRFKTNGVQVLPSAENADLLVEMLSEENEKRILSLSGGGVVREFELYYRVHYRTKLAGTALWSAPQIVEARRDFSYSDANLLAKQNEEKRLYQNMQSDVISSLMRRLSAVK